LKNIDLCQPYGPDDHSWTDIIQWAGSWEARYHLYWRSDPLDTDNWSSLQRGKQLPIAFQAQSSPRWYEEENKSLCWRWWCWQQGRLHQWTHQKDELVFGIVCCARLIIKVEILFSLNLSFALKGFNLLF